MERPERLYAVNLGLSAIYARLEESYAEAGPHTSKSSKNENDIHTPFTVIRSTASLETIPDHPAARDVLHIKSEDEPDSLTYAEMLEIWSKDSRAKIVQKQREVPEAFEADLYCKFAWVYIRHPKLNHLTLCSVSRIL